jgi:hypothetical protein
MGEAAVEELDRWLREGGAPRIERKIPGELRVRASTHRGGTRGTRRA